MQTLPPLASEINRIIWRLSGVGAGLSLLSVSTSSLPASLIQEMTSAAALPNDIVGSLIDGSVGVLTVRPRGDRDEERVEQDFLARLRPGMVDLSERRIGGRVTLWLRAVHRLASDIGHAADLVGCLFDAPATPLTVNADRGGFVVTSARPALYPRMEGPLMPFIEPPARPPAQLIMREEERPHFWAD